MAHPPREYPLCGVSPPVFTVFTAKLDFSRS